MGKKQPNRVEKNMGILEHLQSLTPRQRNTLIKGANKELLFTLSEICLNLINDYIKIPPSEIEKLRPFQEQIYQLSLKKHSLIKRRTIVQKGGFLGTLLGAVLPTLISTIISATSK